MKNSLRIGTSSYILCDDILPNVRYLAPLVDDIELVLFESQGESNLPDATTITELRRLALEYDLTYTVHFPLDVFPGSRDAQVRDQSLATCLKIIDLTKELSPFAYILHLTPDTYGEQPSSDLEAWLEALDESLDHLVAYSGIDSRMFCAETLSYPFSLVLPLVEKHNLSVTLDIGHVWMMGYDAQEACSSLLPRTKVCHLHGVEGTKDHQSLEKGNLDDIERFVSSLVQQGKDGETRVLTLEVFNQYDFLTSLSLLTQSHAMMGETEDQQLCQPWI